MIQALSHINKYKESNIDIERMVSKTVALAAQETSRPPTYKAKTNCKQETTLFAARPLETYCLALQSHYHTITCSHILVCVYEVSAARDPTHTPSHMTHLLRPTLRTHTSLPFCSRCANSLWRVATRTAPALQVNGIVSDSSVYVGK